MSADCPTSMIFMKATSPTQIGDDILTEIDTMNLNTIGNFVHNQFLVAVNKIFGYPTSYGNVHCFFSIVLKLFFNSK